MGKNVQTSNKKFSNQLKYYKLFIRLKLVHKYKNNIQRRQKFGIYCETKDEMQKIKAKKNINKPRKILSLYGNNFIKS